MEERTENIATESQALAEAVLAEFPAATTRTSLIWNNAARNGPARPHLFITEVREVVVPVSYEWLWGMWGSGVAGRYIAHIRKALKSDL